MAKSPRGKWLPMILSGDFKSEGEVPISGSGCRLFLYHITWMKALVVGERILVSISVLQLFNGTLLLPNWLSTLIELQMLWMGMLAG